MSSFLGFESFLIPLGTTVQGIQDTLKTAITSYGWQCLRQALPPLAVLGTFATPANALDYWTAVNTQYSTESNSLPKYLGVQMTSAFTPTVMYLQGWMDAATTAPKDFTLDWSDNGSSWTTHATWTGEAVWTSNERRKYTITSAPAKNYWRINVTARQSSTTTTIGKWVLEDASNNWITTRNFFDVQPPSGETIGNSYSKELIRIFISSTGTFHISPVQQLLTALPQMLVFDTPVAGAVTLSVTINSVTVSYTGTSGDTALQNARGLYEALKNSANSNFTEWNWYWLNSLTSVTGAGPIMAIRNSAVPNINVTSSNITARGRGSYSNTGVQGSEFVTGFSATLDLVNGFIYYLQVNSRGLAIAFKTNAGFSGPYHACYGDNASALAQIPTSGTPGIPCNPIELVVGIDEQNVTYTGAYGRFSHWWGVSRPAAAQNTLSEQSYWSVNPFTKHVTPGQVQDLMSGVLSLAGGNNGTNFLYAQLSSEGIFSSFNVEGPMGDSSGQIYPVHRLSLTTDIMNTYLGGSNDGRVLGPMYDSLDWYRYCGSLSDEQLVFAPSTDFTTALSTTAGPTDLTLTVADTTGFPSAGYLYMESGEVVQYTGLTGTTFTGCTRGRYSTSATTQFSGTTVYIGSWLTKINYGLLFAGYVKPT